MKAVLCTPGTSGAMNTNVTDIPDGHFPQVLLTGTRIYVMGAEGLYYPATALSIDKSLLFDENGNTTKV